MLQVEDLSLRFGGLQVLDGLSFSVRPGSVCALIGPNGAGKTSLFNCVSRLYRPAAGRIFVDGREITSIRPHEAVRYGVARTFQNLALFPTLSVRENVLCGAQGRTKAGMFAAMIRTPACRREERRLEQECERALALTDLTALADAPAGLLPFGVQKRVELARAIMANPRLLLLDEPANGLDGDEVRALSRMLRSIAAELDLTILLVEHHIGMVVGLSDHVVVLDLGRKIAEGAPDEVTTNPAVVDAYLGEAL
ncbi:ABC transporter ATP-binding protein [Nonomuraea typhae]|uniref:ABC transporter ATP-binding protein n=1 Tax=Nonomuraea typhae TaxID=2603600 RepID=UPI0012FA107C|nr:ABC transporter ATP-binding protein [Nonomuraea typhae]